MHAVVPSGFRKNVTCMQAKLVVHVSSDNIYAATGGDRATASDVEPYYTVSLIKKAPWGLTVKCITRLLYSIMHGFFSNTVFA